MVGVYPVPILPDGRRPRVSSGYGGLRQWGLTPGETTHIHQGDDITYPRAPGDTGGPANLSASAYMPEGTMALSVLPGVVSFARPTSSGIGVTVKHDNGVSTRYLHLTQVYVKPGDHVKAGAWLGIIGADPRVGNIKHLHFELLQDGQHVDPEPFLGRLTMLSAEDVVEGASGVPGGDSSVAAEIAQKWLARAGLPTTSGTPWAAIVLAVGVVAGIAGATWWALRSARRSNVSRQRA